LVPASLGSDTGGSIRGPAGLCGISGLKPTYGLVSRNGVLPNSYSYDHCGPMARTSQDCALLLNAIAGHDPADPASSSRPVGDFTKNIGGGLKGLRIGVVRHFWEEDLPVNDEVTAALEQALVVLRELGAVVETVTMRPLQDYSDVKIVMAETELFSLHLSELIARAGDFGQDFRARSLAACLFTAEDYVRASRERRVLVSEMQPLYHRFDLLVTANSTPAPRLDAHDPLAFWKRPSFTAPFNCTGGPALALLCGFSRQGLPLSLQIAGRPHEDALVLRAGHAYEMETGFFRSAPKLEPHTLPAALDPKPWRADTSVVEPGERVLAQMSAKRAGLRLTAEQFEELVAVAPWALAMAQRLRRDHLRTAEVSSIFDPAR
jgi:aspartyl-tRNA(Asn)/glutamyl-tRNA(Gln) amidotransferase subunit A